VNTHGVLSFDRSFNQFEPWPFPISTLSLISPYWEDFSTVRFGRVYYRITSDSNLLLRAQYHLQDLFPSGSLFFLSYLFIATWDRVPQLGTNAPGDATKVSSGFVSAPSRGATTSTCTIQIQSEWSWSPRAVVTGRVGRVSTRPLF